MNPSAFVHPQVRPEAAPVMRQRWEHLLFVHWSWDCNAIQASLPPGLTVDTWNGEAWLGVVPFFMRGVRPSGFPAVPGLSNFLELNVRTYVKDRYGRPGVWFYSLDCNQPLAVWIARRFFHLPYYYAIMNAKISAKSSWIKYNDQRIKSRKNSIYKCKHKGITSLSKFGSLEQFLIERYRLFSYKNAHLYTAEVWHHPYEIAVGDLLSWDAEPLRQAGFDPKERRPRHVVYSPGVDVSIYRLASV